eukprot:GHVL01026867.1.p1 GENE.GHVL01026867.1~~GHVL01026867.1.p1  ORF type:complete len:220 (+),score=19.87 GHVL01026867.1:393-1052(+)
MKKQMVLSNWIGHNDLVSEVDVHKHSVLSSSWDKTICEWSVGEYQPEPVVTFVGHTEAVTCLKRHANDDYFLSGSLDGSIRVWDDRAGRNAAAVAKCKDVRHKGGVSIRCIEWINDNMFCYGGEIGSLNFVDRRNIDDTLHHVTLFGQSCDKPVVTAMKQRNNLLATITDAPQLSVYRLDEEIPTIENLIYFGQLRLTLRLRWIWTPQYVLVRVLRKRM